MPIIAIVIASFTLLLILFLLIAPWYYGILFFFRILVVFLLIEQNNILQLILRILWFFLYNLLQNSSYITTFPFIFCFSSSILLTFFCDFKYPITLFQSPYPFCIYCSLHYLRFFHHCFKLSCINRSVLYWWPTFSKLIELFL